MSISIFLARVLGLYLVIGGILYLGRRRFLEKTILEFYENNSTIILAGIISLMVGLLIVIGHNIWEWNWTLTITLLGYLTLLKAGIGLFANEKINKKLSLKLWKGSSPIFIGIICLIIGLFLIYEGFIVS